MVNPVIFPIACKVRTEKHVFFGDTTILVNATTRGIIDAEREEEKCILTLSSSSYATIECLRKHVFRNLLLQKLSRRQYLRYIFEKMAKMYFIEGRF